MNKPVSEEIKNKWRHRLSLILRCHNNGTLFLNDWELSFIDSIDSKLSKDEEITFNQSSALTKIYERIG